MKRKPESPADVRGPAQIDFQYDGLSKCEQDVFGFPAEDAAGHVDAGQSPGPAESPGKKQGNTVLPCSDLDCISRPQVDVAVGGRPGGNKFPDSGNKLPLDVAVGGQKPDRDLRATNVAESATNVAEPDGEYFFQGDFCIVAIPEELKP